MRKRMYDSKREIVNERGREREREREREKEKEGQRKE